MMKYRKNLLTTHVSIHGPIIKENTILYKKQSSNTSIKNKKSQLFN